MFMFDSNNGIWKISLVQKDMIQFAIKFKKIQNSKLSKFKNYV
jgi:hypothetical protein